MEAVMNLYRLKTLMIIYILLLIFMIPSFISASEDKLRHHLIVLIDRSIKKSNIPKATMEKILNNLSVICFKNDNAVLGSFKLTEESIDLLSEHGISDEILKSLGSLKNEEFTSRDKFRDTIRKQTDQNLSTENEKLILKYSYVPSDRQKLLLPNWDYLSILSSGLTSGAANFENFIQVESYEFTLNYEQNVFHEFLESIYQNPDNFFNAGWGMIPQAPSLSIAFFKGEPTPTIHRTFLAFITDNVYQGSLSPDIKATDLAKKREWDLLTENENVDITLAQNDEERVNGKFAFKSKLNDKFGEITLEIFEVLPNAKYNIYDFLNLPQEIKFYTRTDDDKYKQENLITAKPKQANEYEIIEMKAQLLEADGTVIDENWFSWKTFSQPFEFPALDSNYTNKVLKVEMDFWVHFKPDIYGIHVLYPGKLGSPYFEGLHKEALIGFPSIENIKLFGRWEPPEWLYVRTPSRLPYLKIAIKNQDIIETRRRVVSFWHFVSLCLTLIVIGVGFRIFILKTGGILEIR